MPRPILPAHDREAQRGIGELRMLSVTPPAGKWRSDSKEQHVDQVASAHHAETYLLAARGAALGHRLDWRDAIRSDDAPQAPEYVLCRAGITRRRVSHALQLGLKRI